MLPPLSSTPTALPPNTNAHTHPARPEDKAKMAARKVLEPRSVWPEKQKQRPLYISSFCTFLWIIRAPCPPAQHKAFCSSARSIGGRGRLLLHISRNPLLPFAAVVQVTLATCLGDHPPLQVAWTVESRVSPSALSFPACAPCPATPRSLPRCPAAKAEE